MLGEHNVHGEVPLDQAASGPFTVSSVAETACSDGLNGKKSPEGTVTSPFIDTRAMPGPACTW